MLDLNYVFIAGKGITCTRVAVEVNRNEISTLGPLSFAPSPPLPPFPPLSRRSTAFPIRDLKCFSISRKIPRRAPVP